MTVFSVLYTLRAAICGFYGERRGAKTANGINEHLRSTTVLHNNAHEYYIRSVVTLVMQRTITPLKKYCLHFHDLKNQPVKQKVFYHYNTSVFK